MDDDTRLILIYASDYADQNMSREDLLDVVRIREQEAVLKFVISAEVNGIKPREE